MKLFLLALSLLSLSASAEADQAFHCESDYDDYHFEAIGTVGGDHVTGIVQGIVTHDGAPFQQAQSPAKTSKFVAGQNLAFTASSALVTVTVTTNFANGESYDGVMTVTSFLGNIPPMPTTCIIK